MTDTHQESLPFPGFSPDTQYGVTALSAQLRRMREQRDHLIAAARAEADMHEDRSVFYEACLAQLKEQVGNLAEALSQKRTELTTALDRIEELEAKLEARDTDLGPMTKDPLPQAAEDERPKEQG